MTPFEAMDPANHWILNQQLERKFSANLPTVPKFKANDYVRISVDKKNKFHRAYSIQASNEVFQIHKVHSKGLRFPVYSIKSVGNSNFTPEVLFSRWYDFELVKINKDCDFKVRSVVHRGNRNSVVNFENLQDTIEMTIPNRVLAKKKTFRPLEQFPT